MEFNFILPKNFKEQSISHLLAETWFIPRKQRHFLRMKRHILVNGEPVNDNYRVSASQQITLLFDHEDFPELDVPFGDAKQAEILYEDEHLVIANKPEQMKTHGNSKDELALQNHVAAALKQPVYVVHRLDQATSGLVLFAKNQFVLPLLGQLFEKNKIHRQYLALVKGHFPKEQFIINQPIGNDRHDKSRRIVAKGGQEAITHVEVLQRFPQSTLIRCLLDTGRTHQIRVHLTHLGHPIVGDVLYGGTRNNRLMLHAQELYFKHPFTDQHIKISVDSQTFSENLPDISAQKRPY